MMTYTEDEAKTKWCPFALALGTLERAGVGGITATGSHNRGYAMGGPLHNCMCIGSACMVRTELVERLWRYSNPKYTYGLDDYRTACRDAFHTTASLREQVAGLTAERDENRRLYADTFELASENKDAAQREWERAEAAESDLAAIRQMPKLETTAGQREWWTKSETYAVSIDRFQRVLRDLAKLIAHIIGPHPTGGKDAI